MPSKNDQGAAEISMHIYEKEMKKFFREKGMDVEYDTSEKQEAKAKESLKYWEYHPQWIRNEVPRL